MARVRVQDLDSNSTRCHAMANQQLFAMILSETSDTTTEEFVPVSESPAAVVSTPSVINIGRDLLLHLN